MKDPYSLHLGKIVKQHIWKSGNSYVTPIPKDWVDPLGEINSVEVYLTYSDNWTVILSRKDKNPLSENPRKYDSKKDSPLKFQSDVFGSYMRGDEEFYAHIPLKHTKTRTALYSIPTRLFGAGLDEGDSENYTLTFKDTDKAAFKPRLEDARKRINEMYESNRSAMYDFPNSKNFDNQKELIDTHEKWLDKLSFYMKRLLNKSLFDMELFNRIQIDSRQYILNYDNIVNNIERIGDLHKEICMTIDRIYKRYEKKQKQFSLRPFAEYLETSNKFVKTAFEIMNGKEPENSHDFYSEMDEESGLEYVEGVYEKKKVDKLLEYIETNQDYTRLASILQSRIWGLKGNASNIIESKLNIAKLH